VLFTRHRPAINYRRPINTHFSRGTAQCLAFCVTLCFPFLRSPFFLMRRKGRGWPTRHVSGLRVPRISTRKDIHETSSAGWDRVPRRFSARRWNDGTKAPVVMSPFRPFRAFATRREKQRKRRLRSSFPLAREHRSKSRRGGNMVRSALPAKNSWRSADTREALSVSTYSSFSSTRRERPVHCTATRNGRNCNRRRPSSRDAPASAKRSIASPSSSQDSGVYLFLIEAKRERERKSVGERAPLLRLRRPRFADLENESSIKWTPIETKDGTSRRRLPPPAGRRNRCVAPSLSSFIIRC